VLGLNTKFLGALLISLAIIASNGLLTSCGGAQADAEKQEESQSGQGGENQTQDNDNAENQSEAQNQQGENNEQEDDDDNDQENQNRNQFGDDGVRGCFKSMKRLFASMAFHP
jgi:hypothetical protein